jgi:hypothetical protein
MKGGPKPHFASCHAGCGGRRGGTFLCTKGIWGAALLEILQVKQVESSILLVSRTSSGDRRCQWETRTLSSVNFVRFLCKEH